MLPKMNTGRSVWRSGSSEQTGWAGRNGRSETSGGNGRYKKSFIEKPSGKIRSVDEIVNISESKSTPDKMAYQYLVKQVDKLLRSRALDQQYDAMFEVPAMVLFQPHFDRDLVATRLAKHYRRIGFSCDKNEFTIVLRWDREKTTDSNEENNTTNADDSDDSDVSDNNSFNEENVDESDDDYELPPPRKIVVESAPLSKRVECMKNAK